ncbi:MAG TPA: poly-gamma-glutamate biosynthesis protein PgsC/CapC [bacterium]|nr:poly-gamma-glutamate biosynthesis protein PgsC/CapC [bacterium]HPN43143.1 poly-gamma-glutamate biosynthesis protein PgsC/CapC [bacterium]
MTLLIESIGIGVIFSIFLSEIFGLSAAGLIVPGYLAYYLNQPLHIVIIILATLYTYILERLVSRLTILYGKRLMALDILGSFIFVYLLETMVYNLGFPLPFIMDSIGYFIPALIVIFIGANGLVNTLLSLCLLTLLVRLALLLFNYLHLL